MASNETVAEIVADIRMQNQGLPKDWYAKHPFVDDLLFLADRIESAHKRELAAKDDERLTVVAIYENVIAAKDREIAELQRRLKAAEKFATEMKQTMNSLVRACGHQIILRLQGEGGNNEGK